MKLIFQLCLISKVVFGSEYPSVFKQKIDNNKKKNALDTWILKDAIEQLENRVNSLNDQVLELENFKINANSKILTLERTLDAYAKRLLKKDDEIQSLERGIQAFQAIHTNTQTKFRQVLKLTGMHNGTLQRLNDMESNLLEKIEVIHENSQNNSRTLMDLEDGFWQLDKNLSRTVEKIDSIDGSFDIVSSLQTQQSVDYVDLLRKVGIMESSNHQMQVDLKKFDNRLFKAGKRAHFAMSMMKDTEGNRIRVCVGSTVPRWTIFGDNAIWGEINMSKCKFKFTPKVQTALIGDANHYQITGTSSVYNLAKNVFRIYLENVDKSSWRLNPYNANQYGRVKKREN